MTVLYVEDEQYTREPFAEMLERRVKTVITAENGEEGLKKFRVFKPDMIVTDIKMPEMDGLEMVETIRNEGYKTPVIVTTAFEFRDLLFKSIELGINKYLVKPIKRKAIVDALEDLYHIHLFYKSYDQNNQLLEIVLDTESNIVISAPIKSFRSFNDEFLAFFGFFNEADFQQNNYKSLIDFIRSIEGKQFDYPGRNNNTWIDSFIIRNGIENNTIINLRPGSDDRKYALSFRVLDEKGLFLIILKPKSNIIA